MINAEHQGVIDNKTLNTLEYHKILERLASYTDFSASREKALELRPSNDVQEAQRRQRVTSEAALLLDSKGMSIGGARDVRQIADRAAHGVILDPAELLDVKSTLIAARTLARSFERLEDQFPLLFELVSRLPLPSGMIDAISKAISERGDILDSASRMLEAVRKEVRIVHDRLLSKLQRMVSDSRNAPYLQEPIVTQRDGRFVIPLRSEFKGRIKSIVHDQSSSGATLFVEPISVVELNNQYRELQLAERDEERRILAELSAGVGRYADEIDLMVDIIAELDVALASAKYAHAIKATEPILRTFESRENQRHPGSVLRLWQARHPLLSPDTVVPIDVELDPNTYALVITGPNTGGKTVSLKTVGLLALMAQSGLHIPAQSGSEITVFDNIFADIGDEQSIEQSLSTFSGHITNIIRILALADKHSLVILDELGAGTDPQEGAALARSLMSYLLERSITTLVTTHHPELKTYAHSTPGVVNASVEFDLETLQPTYHLTIGLPGRSNALAIAQRLGLSPEIIDQARSELDPSDLRAEDLLDEIHRQRDLARQARAETEHSRQEADTLRTELAKRLEKIEDERRKVLETAQNQAQQQLELLQDEIRDVRRALARARQPLEAFKEIESKAEELDESLETPIERREIDLVEVGSPAKERRRRVAKPLRLGSKVYLKALGTQGVIISLSEDEAEVQVGMMRVRARRSDLKSASEIEDEEEHPETVSQRHVAQAPEQKKSESKVLRPASPGIELDLRGQRVDDALEGMDRYLESAYLAGLPWVRVIHGKGTGRLRDSVRQALSEHPHVHSFEAGGANEGGDGVTIARLRQN